MTSTITTDIESKRLLIRRLQHSDAAFVIALLNEPSFLKFIGDKNVRNIDDAKNYIDKQIDEQNRQNGIGMQLVLNKNLDHPLGICGIVKRPELNDPDLGYAFLPTFWGQGFALEASRAMLHQNFRIQKRPILLAVTTPDNQPSNRLLSKLGFTGTGKIELYGQLNNLYALTKEHFNG